MSTQYIHRLTIVVPEAMIAQANQLALIVGESPDDVNTFGKVSLQDKSGNRFAVCSAAAKSSVIEMTSNGLPDVLPEHAKDADVTLAQQALDSLTIWQSPEIESPPPVITGLMAAIDVDPKQAISEWGLTLIESGTSGPTLNVEVEI